MILYKCTLFSFNKKAKSVGKTLCLFYLTRNLNIRYNADTDTVQIYYDGTWNDWKAGNMQTVYLYNNGDECTDVTGGWSVSTANSSNGTASVTKGSDKMTLYAPYVGGASSAGSGQAIAFTTNPITITKGTLRAKANGYTSMIFYSTNKPVAKAPGSTTSMFAPTNAVQIGQIPMFDDSLKSFDVSNLIGKTVYLGIAICGLGTGRSTDFIYMDLV